MLSLNLKIIEIYNNKKITKDFKTYCWCDHHHVLRMTHFQAAPSMGICKCLEAQWCIHTYFHFCDKGGVRKGMEEEYIAANCLLSKGRGV